MRPRHNLLSSYRTHERSFHIESKFLKFAGARNQDDLINLVRAIPAISGDAVLPASQITEASAPVPKAKGALAS